jgi:hypothetical protein
MRQAGARFLLAEGREDCGEVAGAAYFVQLTVKLPMSAFENFTGSRQPSAFVGRERKFMCGPRAIEFRGVIPPRN